MLLASGEICAASFGQHAISSTITKMFSALENAGLCIQIGFFFKNR
jgi:hypothetical protein